MLELHSPNSIKKSLEYMKELKVIWKDWKNKLRKR
jgi:hypothetical protein